MGDEADDDEGDEEEAVPTLDGQRVEFSDDGDDEEA